MTTVLTEMRIKITDERKSVREVEAIVTVAVGVDQINLDDGTEWVVAEDADVAGQAAREYWEDMAQNDPTEFTCMVGEETLVRWGLGQPAGPGSTQVTSLSDWLDLWLNTPEEHFASYDSDEHEVLRAGKLTNELGYTPTVAYRCN